MLSRPLNGWLFARAIEPVVAKRMIDIALVNWAYPDAYGVMLVAGKRGFPFATTVQGSDFNVLAQIPSQKRKILKALRASCAVFTRSDALRARLAQEGIEATTVYNGVDQKLFQPRDRAKACRELGLPEDRRRILYVGNLVPIKGPMILAEAFQQLTDVDLIFLGSGSEAAKIPAGERVQLRGARPHAEIATWMNACDVLCLPSLNEGMPNVALEALASGLPVVASRVGGVPEVIREGENGLMVPAEEAVALAAALRKALTRRWDANTIRRSVEKFDWHVNARTVLGVLEKAITK